MKKWFLFSILAAVVAGGNVAFCQLKVDPNGWVGIGNSTDIKNNLNVGSSVNNNEKSILLETQKAKLRFVTSGADSNCWIQFGKQYSSGSTTSLHFTGIWGTPKHMVIKSNGNVGIGTLVPREKFEIVGKARFTSKTGQSSIIIDGSNLDTTYDYSNVRMVAKKTAYGEASFTTKLDNWTGYFNWVRGNSVGAEVEIMRIEGTSVSDSLGRVSITNVLNLKPMQFAPVSPRNGDIYISSVDSCIYYFYGNWRKLLKQ